MQRGLKLRWSSKLFPSLNVINGKSAPYESKFFPRNYHHRSDSNLGLRIFDLIRITCSFHNCTTILSFPWNSIITEACNQKIYGRVFICKYYLILGSHNYWFIIKILYDVPYYVEYEFINRTLLYGNDMNMSLIITKENYGAIDAYDFAYHV